MTESTETDIAARPGADNASVSQSVAAGPGFSQGESTSERASESHSDGPLLDRILERSTQARIGEGEALPARLLDRFLGESSVGRSVRLWLGLAAGDPLPARADLIRRLSRDLATLDGLVERQVNAILHHPSFQKLEASWRGLRLLVDTLPEGRSTRIRVLNLPWAELVQDQSRALEFDQSQLFRKVYEEEFGHPGGEPYGVLLGDYEIHHRPGTDHPFDDVEALGKVAATAAAAFAPFIAGVHPSFFGLDHFAEMERPLDLARTFEQAEYLKWRSLRQAEDARFVGLVLPRVLLRTPHGPHAAPLGFREDVEGPGRDRYLWGNAVYAFGAVLIRCFAQSGWLADVRGVRQGTNEQGRPVCLDEGGLVAGLPALSFATDRRGIAPRCSTDIIITDEQEKELDDLGFIALCHAQDTEFSAFYGNSSIQKPRTYDDPKATANARLSTLLQYLLCVSRFAHYVKVISRDKVGGMAGREEIEEHLRQWLRNYVTANDNAGPEVKARYPLREAKVEVRERRDQPGTYQCTVHLRPHYQLEQLQTAVRLSTQLAPGRPS
jgi:type VI secretion system ImpC/EvpB family protein